MSANELDDFFIQTVTVEKLLGNTAHGEKFDSPVILTPPNGCWVDGGRRLIRDAAGQQVVSESTIYTYPANAALFTPDSRVTINGVQSRVIKINVNESGDLDLPDHVAINIT